MVPVAFHRGITSELLITAIVLLAVSVIVAYYTFRHKA